MLSIPSALSSEKFHIRSPRPFVINETSGQIVGESENYYAVECSETSLFVLKKHCNDNRGCTFFKRQ